MENDTPKLFLSNFFVYGKNWPSYDFLKIEKTPNFSISQHFFFRYKPAQNGTGFNPNRDGS